MTRMLRNRITAIRWRLAGTRGARIRALAGVVVALGMGAATFMALSTLAVTHPKPQPQVVAGAFTTPSASPANPSPGSSPPASLPPRCHASQLAMKMMAWAGAPANEGAYLFLLRDNGPGDCTLSGAPTISWPRGVESNLQGGLLTAPPANGGKGLSENQAYGHGTSQVGPVVLTPDGVPAAFETVVFPGPGVKGIPLVHNFLGHLVGMMERSTRRCPDDQQAWARSSPRKSAPPSSSALTRVRRA